MGWGLAALVAGNLALAGLVLATQDAAPDMTHAHHTLAYALLGVATLAAWPLLRRRRLTTLLLASFGAWSLLTGLWLVYVTPGFGRGRWMGGWHGVTSVAFLLAFLAHWARNNARLVGLAKRLAARPAPLLAFGAAWGLVALLGLASWRTGLRELFSDRFFVELSTLSFVLTLVLLVHAALVLTGRRMRERMDEPAFRNGLRGALDVSLLAMTWLAALSGFPLLYLSRDLRAAEAYWWLAAWHVVASALLVGLALAHASLNARPLRAHVTR